MTENDPKRIHVTLADAPTDVLVYLVDNDSATKEAIADSVAPADADDALRSTGSALALLVDLGFVSPTAFRRWVATRAGRKAVMQARGNRAGA